MIQSSYNQPIAPKASSEVKSKPASSSKPKDLDSALKSNFESELKAAKREEAPKAEKSEKSEKSEVTKTKLNSKEAESEKSVGDKESEAKVDQASAEVSSEDSSVQAATTGQKVFDPALTEDVQSILQPKNAEAPIKLTDEQVLKLAEGEVPAVESEVKGEIAQAMLKTPQVHGGRSPAIDFAQAEIDPQLLGNEDFVAQKNLAAKKSAANSPYGMNKPQLQKIATENGLKQTQIVKDAAAAEGSSQGPLNSQQFILNMKTEMNGSKAQDVQAPQKVFDMSHIKSSNANEVMDQITNYIVQAKAAKEPTVMMRVNHEELGMLDITVQKSMNVGQDAVAISIGAHSLEGKNFFQQNSKELFSHMSSAGINVSDFKVDTSSQTAKNDFDTNQQQQSGRQGSEGGKQFGSEQNQRRHDSDRRQDLWKHLVDKEAA